MKSPRLFTYIIPIDDGAAPNPYFERCTLVICKPAIRRVARKGDWVAGFGSKKMNKERKLVYAMRVDEVLSMAEYDHLCRNDEILQQKIPDIGAADDKRRLGDCIYDYSGQTDDPIQRPSVHNICNRETDLGGKNVLLSDHYVYFGRSVQKVPNELLPIINQNQGHRSNANTDYFDPFVRWVEKLAERHGYGVLGCPDYDVDWVRLKDCSPCGEKRAKAAEEDDAGFDVDPNPKC